MRAIITCNWAACSFLNILECFTFSTVFTTIFKDFACFQQFLPFLLKIAPISFLFYNRPCTGKSNQKLRDDFHINFVTQNVKMTFSVQSN